MSFEKQDVFIVVDLELQKKKSLGIRFGFRTICTILELEHVISSRSVLAGAGLGGMVLLEPFVCLCQH